LGINRSFPVSRVGVVLGVLSFGSPSAHSLREGIGAFAIVRFCGLALFADAIVVQVGANPARVFALECATGFALVRFFFH
jgi:hypothetical protein